MLIIRLSVSLNQLESGLPFRLWNISKERGDCVHRLGLGLSHFQ